MTSSSDLSGYRYHTVKILFCLSVLLLIAKPFIGFELFSRLHPPTSSTILVKSFTKRKQEYVNGSNQDIKTIQKQLSDPVLPSLLLYSFFLNILYPSMLRNVENITAAFLGLVKTGSMSEEDTYLLSGKLSI